MSLDGSVARSCGPCSFASNSTRVDSEALDLHRPVMPVTGISRRELLGALCGMLAVGTGAHLVNEATRTKPELDDHDREYVRALIGDKSLPWQVHYGRKVESCSVERGEETIRVTKSKNRNGTALYVLQVESPNRNLSYRNWCFLCDPKDKGLLEGLLASAQYPNH